MPILPENFNILLVEDNPTDLFLLEEMLKASRLKIDKTFTATRLEEAKLLLEAQSIQLVLLDLSLPDSFGIASLKELKSTVRKIPFIILTGLSDSTVAFKALNEGAQDYLVKGEFNVLSLCKSIEYSLERKKAEERVFASEKKYKQIFHKNPFPMWITESDTLQILEVNDAAIHTYGYSRDEFLQLTLCDIQEITPGELHLSKNSGQTTNTYYHTTKNGDKLVVELTYYAINYFDYTAIQMQVNDITEKTRLEKELDLKKKQLIEAVFKAQEIERKNIGEELHDNINQILAAAKLNLTALKEKPEEFDILLENSANNLALAMREIREMSKGLIIPGHLREVGLISSIEYLLQEMLRHTRITWKLFADDIEDMLKDDHRLAIYRIVQEQLNNIIKHANASFIKVSVSAKGSMIHLIMEDNGSGFVYSSRRNGIGITNIISRAELFNGNVNFKSSPGEGCSMEVTLSLEKRTTSLFSSVIATEALN